MSWLSSLGRSRAAIVSIAFSVSQLGCDEQNRPNAIETVPGTEPSPNASLLPDPLPGGASPQPDAEAKLEGVGAPPTPFLPELPLARDELPKDASEGDQAFEFVVRVLSRRGTKLATQPPRDLDLVLQGSLLVPQGRKPERLRLVMTEGPWLFPLGTELRARADRLGHLLVWPDARSYRIAPVGSLLSLLGERRADVMPRFSPTFEGTRSRGGAWLGTHVLLKTPIGQLRLETRAPGSNAEPSGQMLCRSLLELIRARGADVCAGTSFPREAELLLEGGQPVKLTVSVPTRVTDVQPRRFWAPPDLPIFKPGEYPPSPLGPLGEAEETKLLAELGARRVEDGRGNVVITNGLGLPVLLFLQDRPVRYLATQEALQLEVERPLSYEVESLFGLLRSAKGKFEPNSDVLLGGSPEVQALGKPRVEE